MNLNLGIYMHVVGKYGKRKALLTLRPTQGAPPGEAEQKEGQDVQGNQTGATPSPRSETEDEA